MNQMTLKNMMKNPMNAIYLQILQIFQIWLALFNQQVTQILRQH